MSESAPQLTISETISIPWTEFEFAYVRSSGPGGQNVNKVNSQVQLFWDLSQCQSVPSEVLERLRHAQRGRITKEDVLRIDCQRFRDREKNRQDCLDRLREMLVSVSRPPKKRRKTRVPRRVKEERLRHKQKRAEVKRTRRSPRLDD